MLAIGSVPAWLRATTMLLFGLVVLVGTVTPMAAIAVTALSRTLSGGLALDNMSFEHFLAVAESGGEAMAALGTSLALGIATALLTGALGILAAFFLYR